MWVDILVNIRMAKEQILELLWEGPKSLSEITKLTGLTRQAVIKTLKKLIMEEAVIKEKGKRGKYLLTLKGMSEYYDRRKDKLLYNFNILPKLYIPYYYKFDDMIHGIGLTNLRELPAPISYMARMYISKDLEEEFQYWRRLVSYEDLVEVRPEDTLREITSEFVNSLVWSILLERLASCIGNGKSINELEDFHIRLTLDISFKPSKNVLRRTAALLSLYAINKYFEISDVTIFDMIRYLEEADENLRGLADLVEKASDIKVEKVKEGENLIRVSSRIKTMDKNRAERIEAIKILLNKVVKILRDEGQIDRKSYIAIKKAISAGSNYRP